MQLHPLNFVVPFFISTSALALTVGLTGCQPEPPQVLRPAPLPQDEHIQVFMNHAAAVSYTEPYRHYTRDGSNLEQVIIDTIASAQSTIDVAVQELRLPGIAEALTKRHQAGVQVRVILENTYSQPYSQLTAEAVKNLPERERDRYQEARRLIDLNEDDQLAQDEINQRDALVILDNAHIPRIDDTADGSAGSNLMHHKFLVVDGKIVIVSSANLTTSDVHGDFKSQHSRGNANNLLRINSPELAAIFTEEFDYMWGDGPGARINSRFGVKKPFRPARQLQIGTTQVEVQFSPSSRAIPWEKSTNGLISETLSRATQSIHMALFVFSDQQLVNQVEPLHQKGVTVKVLIEPSFAYRSYSEALDMMGISLMEDCKNEVNNRPWKNAAATVGVPRMTPGDLLHHKFGIVDGQTTVTGSHNWTDAANIGNDETVLVIHNRIVTTHYQQEFERLYTNAVLGVPPAIQKKASENAKRCYPRNSQKLGQDQAIQVQRKLPSQEWPNPKHIDGTHSSITTKQPGKLNSAFRHRVNLNTATQSELEQLPGVGAGLAKRIMVARTKNRFTSLADLDQVSGIGPKLLQKLKDHVEW